ncbi:aminodeoxychorismate synthase component I [Massilia violaceinigra]|uniref:Aminodeoxychorismate synthase component I n=1 Tax=Massilia violaceinigra TaxID=2045208 RepID=A0ABY4AC33_9BURK|nr:aminodeoxychorismate synthase component I [Massilia violaceinigra]UOD32248.1 aminodeoxychorismate synthase component I [Massilia violaceinigra]
MNSAPCFALLDDATGAGEHAASRLYTGHAGTLRCDQADDWPTVLAQLQQALARGLHAVAVLAYELGGHLLGIDTHAIDSPLAQVLLFDTCTRLSSAEVTVWLDAQTAAQAGGGDHPAGIANVRANVGQQAFSDALARIHDYIAAGDTYQVNYTYRLHFDAFGSPRALYARLRARQPVPYGALIALPDGGAVLSLSPELFVRHQGGELVARPMKGTAPASDDELENARRASALAADPKNRAENLMIVDLLRNDLGRVAVTGSVAVPALFDVQRFSSVLQMTSTVRARLRPDAALADIFAALYPCGSITGAPKRRAMEIIRELEPAARGVYTGAIGWFEPPAAPGAIGDFCLSVPIRTLALQPEHAGTRRGEMGVGAGIVYDSDCADEYAECQLKARFLTGLQNQFEVFETLHATREDGCRQRERHLARMAQSARYFGFAFDETAAHAALDAACAALAPGVASRMRLAIGPSGDFSVQSGALAALTQPVRVLLAPDAMRADDLFLRHKTSIRTRYDAAWRAAEAQGAFDMLFFNERDELTEGGRSNVFVQVDGRWRTPALACGLLPGIMRALVLADPQWDAEETIVTRAMFERATGLMICNALRGPMPAVLA